MIKIESIQNKVEKVEKLIIEIKEALQELESSLIKSEKPKRKPDDEMPSEIDLKNEFNSLFDEYLLNKSEKIDEYVKSKKLLYLKQFCKVNSIPQKTSKKNITEEILICFKQKKVIEKV